MALPGRVSLRKAIHESGGVIAEIATRYDVTRQTVYNWLDHYQMRDEIGKARGRLREIASDAIYERLLHSDEDKRFEAARFVMLHLRDDGELLALSPETLAIMRRLGLDVSDVVREFEAMIRLQAVSAGDDLAQAG